MCGKLFNINELHYLNSSNPQGLPKQVEQLEKGVYSVSRPYFTNTLCTDSAFELPASIYEAAENRRGKGTWSAE